jgi:hypothetical protein
MGPSLRDEAHRVWMELPVAAPRMAPPGMAALARFMADWPAAAPIDRARPPAVHPLPVLRWLPRMAADAAGFGADFVKALSSASAMLDWRQTYSVAEVGERFLQNYGWAEILEPGPASGAAQVSCGVLVLGPDTFYPPHRHEAEEIYLPLVGTAEWLKGEATWHKRPPGSLIHHSSEEPHAMRTGDESLLAMYLWRSTDLHQGARLDRRGAG